MDFTEFKERRRATRRRMCLNKLAHTLKDQAEQHRQRLLDLPDARDPKRLDVYCCLYCWHWHVGHTPQTKVIA